jgi:hypothetical protein
MGRLPLGRAKDGARLAADFKIDVRRMLEDLKRPLVANQDWYRRMSERFTHTTPHTVPGMHDTPGKGFVGPLYQQEGLKFILENLATVLGSLAMLVYQFAKFDDLFGDINAILDRMAANSGLDRTVGN